MSYTLNPEAAKKAGASNRITETGAYVGAITVAWEIESTKGTKGVEMMFKTDEGLTADYLQVWTKNADGKELSGNNMIHAIMACTELRNLTLKPGEIKRGEESKKVQTLAELTGKRIGLMLEKEPYTKNDGGQGFRMVIVCPFEADTKRTAKEKLERLDKAEAYPKLVARLKDRPMQKPQGAPAQSHAPATTDNGPDDDIPF